MTQTNTVDIDEEIAELEAKVAKLKDKKTIVHENGRYTIRTDDYYGETRYVIYEDGVPLTQGGAFLSGRWYRLENAIDQVRDFIKRDKRTVAQRRIRWKWASGSDWQEGTITHVDGDKVYADWDRDGNNGFVYLDKSYIVELVNDPPTITRKGVELDKLRKATFRLNGKPYDVYITENAGYSGHYSQAVRFDYDTVGPWSDKDGWDHIKHFTLKEEPKAPTPQDKLVAQIEAVSYGTIVEHTINDYLYRILKVNKGMSRTSYMTIFQDGSNQEFETPEEAVDYIH